MGKDREAIKVTEKKELFGNTPPSSIIYTERTLRKLQKKDSFESINALKWQTPTTVNRVPKITKQETQWNNDLKLSGVTPSNLVETWSIHLTQWKKPPWDQARRIMRQRRGSDQITEMVPWIVPSWGRQNEENLRKVRLEEKAPWLVPPWSHQELETRDRYGSRLEWGGSSGLQCLWIVPPRPNRSDGNVERDAGAEKVRKWEFRKRRKKDMIMGWRVRGGNTRGEEVLMWELKRRSRKKIFRRLYKLSRLHRNSYGLLECYYQ